MSKDEALSILAAAAIFADCIFELGGGVFSTPDDIEFGKRVIPQGSDQIANIREAINLAKGLNEHG